MTVTHTLPLEAHRLVDTRSVEEAREAIGRIFCPHFLIPTDGAARGFHARHSAVRQTGYSVNHVAYGATVEIDPGELADFFLLQIPLRGKARVRCGTRLAEVRPGLAGSMLSPTLATRMTWFEGCEKLIVQIDRDALIRQFAALSGRMLDRIEFDTPIDLASAAGRALSRHVALAFEAAEEAESMPEAYRVMLRDGLTTLLLSGFAHTGRAELERPVRDAGPQAVRRAEAFILGNIAEPLPASDIADHSGVSLRALQDGFRKARGVTIGEFILNARLDAFRSALVNAARADMTVAEAALGAGLGHLGRAAEAYRRRFGELPSQTLARVAR